MEIGYSKLGRYKIVNEILVQRLGNTKVEKRRHKKIERRTSETDDDGQR